MNAAARLLIAAATALCGCHGGTGSEEVPARLVEPTAAGHAELVRVVARALGVDRVTLPTDALTTDGRLILEPAPGRDLEHGRIMGRDPGRPVQFRLVKQGTRCFLVATDSDEHWELTESRCIAQ